MKSNLILIAIDGYAGCGKSTIARALADKLEYLFLDTGAMYRAVTLYYIMHDIKHTELELIAKHLPLISIDFEKKRNMTYTLLNGVNVENKIRDIQVSSLVTSYSAVPIIRHQLIAQQRRIGAHKGIVMDGRDIGTVVFPNAELKLFITASLEVRAERRLEEFQSINPNITLEKVKQNLFQRDTDETSRLDSPLIKADDAIEIDTTYLSKTAAIELAYAEALRVINAISAAH